MTCPEVLGEAAGQRAHGKVVAHMDERTGPSAASFPLSPCPSYPHHGHRAEDADTKF